MAPTTSKSNLCDSCRAIDFTAFLPTARLDFEEAPGYIHQGGKSGIYMRHPDGSVEPERGYGHFQYKIDIGPLKDIVSRAEACPFCRMVVKTLKKHEGTEELRMEIDGVELLCRVYKEKIGNVQDLTPGLPYKIARSGWEISCMRFACFSKVRYQYKGFAAPHAAYLASHQSRTLGPSYLGNARPSRCNISLFKSWISCCKSYHQHRVDISAARTLLRLIDVEDKCLVAFEIDQQKPTSYIALSYVWGNCNRDFMLTTRNQDKYKAKNGMPHLPKTIADAIEVVHRLEQKYLWVDSLCILQDDNHDKLAQLPAMKAIYGDALVTIVAAAGGSADAGLPGVNSDRMEPLVIGVGDYRIIEATTLLDPFKGSPLTKTTWNTRAWTFQELLLSPRALIFLDEQVYWRCENAEWFEELDFDDWRIQFIWGNDNIEGRTDLTVQNYGNLMEQYTKRKLKYDDDIYDAFSGILEAIPDEFFWAIPHSKFGEYLVWDEAWWSDRREDDPPLHLRGLPDCPSWSWMAWKGQVSMKYDGSDPLSLISCYRFRNGQLERISTPTIASFPLGNPDMDRNLPDEVIWENEDEYSVTMADIPDNVVLKENHAIFWTYVSMFPVPKSEKPPNNGESELKEEYHGLALIGTHGWGDLHMLELSWDSGVAKRERLHSNGARRLRSGDAEKMLIILG